MAEELVAELIKALRRPPPESKIETMRRLEARQVWHGYTVASDNLIDSSDTSVEEQGLVYVKKKEFAILMDGTYRVSFQLRTKNALYQARGRIYVDGVAYGTERSTNLTTYTTYSEDLDLRRAELLQLYIKIQSNGGVTDAQARYFRIYGDTYIGGAVERTV